MKVHNHSEQFDSGMHPVCWRGTTAGGNKIVRATASKLRCKICEQGWFPGGQPDWHYTRAVKDHFGIEK